MPNLKTHAKELTTSVFNFFVSLSEKPTPQQLEDILFHKNEGTLDLFLANPKLDEKETGLQKSLPTLLILADSGNLETLTDILSQDYVLDVFKTNKRFFIATGWLVKNLNEQQTERILSATNKVWNTYDKSKFEEYIATIKKYYAEDKDCVLVSAYLDPRHICQAMETSMRIQPAEQKVNCEMA